MYTRLAPVASGEMNAYRSDLAEGLQRTLLLGMALQGCSYKGNFRTLPFCESFGVIRPKKWTGDGKGMSGNGNLCSQKVRGKESERGKGYSGYISSSNWRGKLEFL